jgi:hypothetical protein
MRKNISRDDNEPYGSLSSSAPEEKNAENDDEPPNSLSFFATETK